MNEVDVAELPSQIDPQRLPGSIAVVIDVLRASTTIVHALAAGARAIIPCREVEEARAIAAGLESERVLLGGERHGRLIDGFDLDNSPFSYTPARVSGCVIVFTTTNGTQALASAVGAERILIGAFVNLSAIVEELASSRRPVWLVCAGTDGVVTEEDGLFAGAVVSRLATGVKSATQPEVALAMTPAAIAVSEAYGRSGGTDREHRVNAMTNSRGGRNLIKIGNRRDIERAAQIDLFSIIPEYDPATGRITAREIGASAKSFPGDHRRATRTS